MPDVLYSGIAFGYADFNVKLCFDVFYVHLYWSVFFYIWIHFVQCVYFSSAI